MGNWKKTLEKVMSGDADNSIQYDALCTLLHRLGYTSHQSGSHKIFRKQGSEFINIQNAGGKAKAYQVKQIRNILKG